MTPGGAFALGLCCAEPSRIDRDATVVSRTPQHRKSSFFSNARSTARTLASPRHLAHEMDHADTSSVCTDHESSRSEGRRSAPDAAGWTAAGNCSRACRKVICIRQGAASMPDSPRSCYSDRMRSTMPATKTAKGGAASRGCSNANSSQRSGRTRHPTPHQRLDWNARTKSQIQPTTIRRLASVLMGGLRARRPGVPGATPRPTPRWEQPAHRLESIHRSHAASDAARKPLDWAPPRTASVAVNARGAHARGVKRSSRCAQADLRDHGA